MTGEDQTGATGTGACGDSRARRATTLSGAQSGIDNPQSLAVSPDGASLYLASGNDASVARFDRASDGALTYQGCITGEIQSGPSGSGGNDACADAPVMTSTAGQPGGGDSGFDNMRDVVVSPERRIRLRGCRTDASVIRYSRAGGGAIAFAGLHERDRPRSGLCTPIGSAQTGTPRQRLSASASRRCWRRPRMARASTTSASNDSGSGDVLGGRAARAAPGETDTAPPDTTISASPKKKTKKKQASFAFTSTRGGRRRSSASSTTTRSRPAPLPSRTRSRRASTASQVRAIDAAGNVDPTPATFDWKVKKKKKKK